MLYFSLVYPYLCYCVGVWGSTYPSNLKRVVTLQKRAIRIISKSKFDAQTDPLFKELKMLKLDSIIRFHICKLMYLYRHGLLPERFDNMFPLNNEIHSYNTRSRSCFSLPYCRTNIYIFFIYLFIYLFFFFTITYNTYVTRNITYTSILINYYYMCTNYTSYYT